MNDHQLPPPTVVTAFEHKFRAVSIRTEPAIVPYGRLITASRTGDEPRFRPPLDLFKGAFWQDSFEDFLSKAHAASPLNICPCFFKHITVGANHHAATALVRVRLVEVLVIEFRLVKLGRGRVPRDDGAQ